jgi:hypothetical protein
MDGLKTRILTHLELKLFYFFNSFASLFTTLLHSPICCYAAQPICCNPYYSLGRCLQYLERHIVHAKVTSSLLRVGERLVMVMKTPVKRSDW